MHSESRERSLDFTVVIPTYNGAQRLPSVLSRLQAQKGLENVLWEIIIVDNNSQDETATCIHQWQQQWQGAASLRAVFEPRQGTAFARQRGVTEAQGHLIGFVDDDNWPAPDWIAAAIAFGERYPDAGAFSGRVHEHFESSPQEALGSMLTYLSVRDKGPTALLFHPEKLQLPPGAGLVIRRQAWLESVPDVLRCTGGGGDDYESLLYLAKGHWQIWYNPQMVLEHFISADRLRRDYLRSLARRYGLCTWNLILVNTTRWQSPFRLMRFFLGSLHRTVQHLAKYRLHSRHSLEADCLLAFHLANLQSPFVCGLNHLKTALSSD